MRTLPQCQPFTSAGVTRSPAPPTARPGSQSPMLRFGMTPGNRARRRGVPFPRRIRSAMSSPDAFDDRLLADLAAAADGTLDPARAAEIETLAAHDDVLAEALER